MPHLVVGRGARARDAVTGRAGPRLGRRWVVAGRVQGVGFRPFVHNLAVRLGLGGWVRNEVGEVAIVAEGEAAALDAFERALVEEAPPLARPVVRGRAPVDPAGAASFAILPSLAEAEPRIHVPPDVFACDACLAEMRDSGDRRHGYPFTNCTQCGPRYTLLLRLPWDRPNTTMADFPMCAACRAEYEDPANRRFHAEPIACAACGPMVTFAEGGGNPASPAAGDAALDAAVRALREGRALAVKGIGGYHLVCDAANEEAVRRLRERKPRPAKPLAVMFPDEATLMRLTAPDDVHLRALRDPLRPIVLVPKRGDGAAARATGGAGESPVASGGNPAAGGRAAARPLASGIAPGLGEIGAFLPYSPLHHLLLDRFGGPVVATSANVSGEPVLTGNADVERRLGHVAEAFLHHDRPIERPADDPVCRVIAGAPRAIRLGRGVAPVERALPFTLPRPVLAAGGHMKNTVALAWEDRVVISPHVGDLDAPRSLDVFARVIADLQTLYRVRAEVVVHDAHPRYASARWARASGLPATAVFHHRAHASGLAGEYPEEREWIVFTWDAVGYGEDGTLWGGEGFTGRPGAWRRAASIRPFRLPGGEKAGREPWRSAAGACWEAGLAWPGAPQGLEVLRAAREIGLNAPVTSGVGRLFDAAAALTGVCEVATFEGEGPMKLEAVAVSGADPWEVRVLRNEEGLVALDWAPFLAALLHDGAPVGERAGRFHATLAAALLAQARALREESGIAAVGLTGGVFQNRLLAESALALLAADGFRVYLPREVPANDGGLCFGQVMEYGAVSTFPDRET